ncbi:hypothetical protein SSX86_015933 [Deinandra increscens subsp. villosa]|uniref:ZF-HD dimerization-type domain-containing protein n=1 Tax=Deinandra increscens subsp. villosa TaxID=3103831 RepID=A0AAP0CYP3_9ASTR
MDPKHPTIKIPHHQTQTPPHLRSTKPPSFPNPKTHHHHPPHPPPYAATGATGYKECLKNHAVGIGGHALDGCGEFMSSTTLTATEPSTFICAACGCHRNFHRREPTTTTAATSPPPASPPNYAFGRHLLLSLTTAADQTHTVATPGTPVAAIKIGERKRFRTKFSPDQKQKMVVFAEKVGWKIQGCDDKMVADFCNEIGIRRRVFKVWMHNNKNTSGGKREKDSTTAAGGTTATTTLSVAAVGSSNEDSPRQENGSSSSS